MNELPPILLLHGSWHGAWCWHKVAPSLRARGHRVIVPDLPAHGTNPRALPGLVTLSAMTRSIEASLALAPAPAIMVAHSRSGIVASSVAERCPDKLAGVVYLASFMLRDGERVADFFFADEASSLRGNVHIDRLRLTDMIASHVYEEALYADCAEEDVALARALLSPEPSLPALTRLSLSARRYGAVPRAYIELTEDRAVSLALQRGFVERSPVHAIRSIDASHSAYFSRPDALTQAIVELSAELHAENGRARAAGRPGPSERNAYA